jgi:hypothetical protein
VDTSVLFHGTSSFSAAIVEKEGLRPQKSIIADDELQAVAALYEEIQWAGTDLGGYAVLRPWSLGYDRRAGQPLFFGESCVRTSTWATQDFAGGDTVRALRRAISDLEQFAQSPDLIEHHLEQCRARNRSHRRRGIPTKDLPVAFDKDRMLESLGLLKATKMKCEEVYREHAYGVLYAVRLPADLKRHRTNFMGIEVREVVPPDLIIDALQVPNDWQPWESTNCSRHGISPVPVSNER